MYELTAGRRYPFLSNISVKVATKSPVKLSSLSSLKLVTAADMSLSLMPALCGRSSRAGLDYSIAGIEPKFARG